MSVKHFNIDSSTFTNVQFVAGTPGKTVFSGLVTFELDAPFEDFIPMQTSGTVTVSPTITTETTTATGTRKITTNNITVSVDSK